MPTSEGFILTSNRDEALVRKPAEYPHIETIEKVKVLFPRDGEAGGTWVATADNKRTVCLLNGAFAWHKHNPPYRKSRGLVVLDFFKTESALSFNQDYDLEDIEPFTLLIAEYNELFELRWDGSKKYFRALDRSVPHILCSATLYTPQVIAMRQKWFANWLINHHTYTLQDILNFHLFAGEGDEQTQIRMSIYGIVKTVSITSIKLAEHTEMYYSDLSGENSYTFEKFNFQQSVAQKNPELIIPKTMSA